MKKSVKKKAATKKKAVTKKAVTKKAVAKKAVTKKAATKKKAVAKAVAAAPAKLKAAKKAYTKTEILTTISEQIGVSKKDVGAVFDSLADVIEVHVKKGAVGNISIPGLFKVKTIRKPATRARKGINPFTGEETMFKAKPARTIVKVQPLKKLKDMV